MQSSLAIRPETVHDYAAIADLHACAFGNRSHEPMVVTLLRHRAAFDPELSLVADRDGRVVGHVLFSPHTIRLLGHVVRAVNLAPIAVEPARQGQGIGGALIEEGHRIARARGYAVSFLLGHSSYYPRFGYRTRAYGWSQVTVVTEGLTAERLEVQAPRPDDIDPLGVLWRQAEAEVDFAIEPGPDLLDWISPNPAIEALVYRRDGEVVGYTRIHRSEPAEHLSGPRRGGGEGDGRRHCSTGRSRRGDAHSTDTSCRCFGRELPGCDHRSLGSSDGGAPDRKSAARLSGVGGKRATPARDGGVARGV